MTEKSCVVVGAGPGIGLAVAKRFGREGFQLALVARRAEALTQYVADLEQTGLTAHAFPADAADFNSLVQAFTQIQAQLGPPEVLVYNAAVVKPEPPSTLPVEDLSAAFRVNVAGALVCAQQVIPKMKARQRGTILFTGGGLALNPYPAYASLAAGKAALRNLTYSLGADLEAEGIQVATVTIAGFVKPGTHFAPDLIAEKYWELHSQPPGQREREIVYR
ncbi:MAG: SDR family NAD(P)-dependent oxidoreductase [Anaerolineae bacterium]|nr:SDR family NAD(P)-dependent oxidoreductase [Anaerolineae bacterium]MCB0222678.1 SDR family NAD(P)-dependent oxidoreductase [Anaerolineae bacterium]